MKKYVRIYLRNLVLNDIVDLNNVELAMLQNYKF